MTHNLLPSANNGDKSCLNESNQDIAFQNFGKNLGENLSKNFGELSGENSNNSYRSNDKIDIYKEIIKDLSWFKEDSSLLTSGNAVHRMASISSGLRGIIDYLDMPELETTHTILNNLKIDCDYYRSNNIDFLKKHIPAVCEEIEDNIKKLIKAEENKPERL